MCVLLLQVRYTRCNNNPSQVVLGEKLAELEGEGGVWPDRGGGYRTSLSHGLFLSPVLSKHRVYRTSLRQACMLGSRGCCDYRP